jgi:hypothetical protein
VPNRVCEGCGEGFWQGQGRPARRCGRCRGSDRYGPAHQELRAATIDQAVGQPCARCRQPMLAGQVVHLDHADDGSGEYLGYSHASCNASAGASLGNKARAQAYRLARGLAMPMATSAGARVLVDDHACADAGCHVDPAVCACGRHSRGW